MLRNAGITQGIHTRCRHSGVCFLPYFALTLDFRACDEFVARGSQVCMFALEVTLAVVLARERLLATWVLASEFALSEVHGLDVTSQVERPREN